MAALVTSSALPTRNAAVADVQLLAIYLDSDVSDEFKVTLCMNFVINRNTTAFQVL